MASRAIIAACLLAAGCRSAQSLEKGGLQPVNVSSETLDRAYEPRRFALLIGVPHTLDDQWRPLQYAQKDAEDLARTFKDPKLGHFDDVRLLTDEQSTTRAGILLELKALAERATRSDDVVAVYVSAHGTLARDEKGVLRRYLVTYDAQLRKVSETALSMEDFKQAFEALPSRRRLLVLATCHSGGGKSLLPQEVEAELAGVKAGFYAPPLEESSRASVVLSASDFGETAREDETLQNDIYTYFLVEALGGGADRNFDGAVTATEAHDWARRRTFAFTQGRQRPSAEILEVGADPIVLSGAIARDGRPELFSYSPRLDGFTLKVDGEDRLELPGGAAVLPGTRKIELTKGDSVLVSRDVSLQLGERVDLDALIEEQEPRRSASLVGGAFGLADGRSRAELLPITWSAGLAVRFERLWRTPLAAQVCLSGAFGRQSLALSSGAVPFDFRMVMISAAVDYLWKWQRLMLMAGPAVAALWVQRSFDLATYRAAQNAFSFSPGVEVAAAFALPWNLEVSLRSQLMVAFMSVDGQSQALGFFGLWAGAGYRF